ncbi:MAG TPA: TOBE domain-containing protein [Verrucomicrobiae bacterium]|jgi:molybdate transport system regulatory protein
MNISARNKLVGKITKITSGVVNAEIVIALPGGGEIVSVITKTSAKALKLKTGSPVVAIIKASDILLAVPCGNPDCKCGK